MILRTLIIFSLIPIVILLLFPASMSSSTGTSNCAGCHEKTYERSISNIFGHSVARKNCATCHIRKAEADHKITRISLPGLQTERIVHLDKIDENLKYEMEIVLTDDTGVNSEPHFISFTPKKLWGQGQMFSMLKRISDIEVEEVKREGFVNATISWDTDTFATSEIEYRTTGEYGNRFKVNNQFTKRHKIVLRGLKHKKKYLYQVISKDINGTVVKSGEHILDTSDSFSRSGDREVMDELPPALNSVNIFRVRQDKGVYMKVYASKPSELLINLKELPDTDDKHGPGLFPERYSTIKICYQCHPQDASHPVGIRSGNPGIKIPDSLPTIEDGVITCVTCHDPHGSNKRFFTRVDYKKDLCLNCHIKGYE